MAISRAFLGYFETTYYTKAVTGSSVVELNWLCLYPLDVRILRIPVLAGPSTREVPHNLINKHTLQLP